MAPKQGEDTGRDIKSIVINIAMALLMLLPFAAYKYQDDAKTICLGVCASFLLAYIVPPVGWMRPHPYSDMPANYPYPRKNE